MRRLLVAALGGAALALALAIPAGAHGGDGALAVQATPHGLTLDYVTRLTFVGDGDPADEATVTVSATGPAPVASVTLAPQGDGNYTGSLTLPGAGTWTVVLESTNPPARVEQTQVVTDAAEATTTSTGPEPTPLTRVEDPGAGNDTNEDAASEGGGDSALPIIAFVVIGGLAGVGIGFWLVRRNARPKA